MNIQAEVAPHRFPPFLRTLAWIQIPIAMVAVAVSLTAAWRIKPLIEQERTLKEEIAKSEELLGNSKAQLQQAQASLDEQQRKFTEMQNGYERQIGDLKKQTETLNEELAEAQERLARATDLTRYNHPIDMMSVKSLFSQHPDAARSLERILELRRQGVRWRLGGNSPEEGFDSPGFAAFILRQMSRLPSSAGEGRERTSRALADSLRAVQQPTVGDLVFYRTGYVMFYFTDQRNRPFVIGMTPFGIAALEPGFAEFTGYRSVSLGPR